MLKNKAFLYDISFRHLTESRNFCKDCLQKRAKKLRLSCDQVWHGLWGRIEATAHVTPIEWTNPRTGGKVLVPKGVDPGFDYNVGIDRFRGLGQ